MDVWSKKSIFMWVKIEMHRIWKIYSSKIQWRSEFSWNAPDLILSRELKGLELKINYSLITLVVQIIWNWWSHPHLHPSKLNFMKLMVSSNIFVFDDTSIHTSLNTFFNGTPFLEFPNKKKGPYGLVCAMVAIHGFSKFCHSYPSPRGNWNPLYWNNQFVYFSFL